jgi:hypothetical protein
MKNQLPLQFVEIVWFKPLILHICPRLVFLFKKQFSHEIVLKLEEKNKISICFTKIRRLHIATSFNLRICKRAHESFAFFINFLGSYWQPKQLIIGLFETIKTIGQNLATNLTNYGLRKKTIAYVKNEGSNLTIMTITLK